MPRPIKDKAKPLSLPVLHIMLALADGPKHGYAIKQDVDTRTRGSIRLGPGTLYEAVQRLEDAGWISESDPAQEPANGQEAQRRYYRLTERGWSALAAEVRQLEAIVDRARLHPRLRKALA